MRAHYTILLVIAALLVSTSATPSRLLRTEETAKDEDVTDEERKTPKILERLKTWNADRKASPTLKQAISAFKDYELKEQKGLFGTTAFKVWAKKVKALDQENAGSIMLTILLRRYDDITLARLIGSSKFSEWLKSIATDLQGALFAKWKQAGMKPNTIEAQLLKKPNTQLWGENDKELVKAYTAFFNL
ncbi:hypothetical protein L914_09090 [Phytophthora nicotianae]|uniref:RxLR effector protein n=1 Tax=Phytophthora nicotianae TaxID=4792 RepID=W2NDI8_PHYNI|nr:hypothetical protein L914_09090 [Phytophthora nicotianae]